MNSVSFVDGKKYHSSPGSYYFDVRSTSDALCRRILADVPQISEQLQQAEAEQQEQVRKEERKREYQR